MTDDSHKRTISMNTRSHPNLLHNDNYTVIKQDSCIAHILRASNQAVFGEVVELMFAVLLVI